MWDWRWEQMCNWITRNGTVDITCSTGSRQHQTHLEVTTRMHTCTLLSWSTIVDLQMHKATFRWPLMLEEMKLRWEELLCRGTRMLGKANGQTASNSTSRKSFASQAQKSKDLRQKSGLNYTVPARRDICCSKKGTKWHKWWERCFLWTNILFSKNRAREESFFCMVQIGCIWCDFDHATW
jgi:hypothetical protein